MDEIKRLRITNMPTVYTWWIGFLFTLGYVGLDLSGGFFRDVLEIVIAYVIWPYILGVQVGLL